MRVYEAVVRGLESIGVTATLGPFGDRRSGRREAAPITTAWREVYEGGGPEAERLLFDKLAVDLMRVQLKNKQRAKKPDLARTFHAKTVYTSVDAELCFVDNLPTTLRAGFAQPGKRYAATVRFSNANGFGQSDHEPDMRGLAFRITADGDVTHDFLATNYPVSHARNARQFVAFAKATAGGPIDRVFGMIGLVFKFGPFEVARMLANVVNARRKASSLALETYWSRGAIRWGETPKRFRYQLRPTPVADAAPVPNTRDPNFLSAEFAGRLEHGEVKFDLCIQTFINDNLTPIEDTATAWSEEASSPIKIATLVIRKPVGSNSGFWPTAG